MHPQAATSGWRDEIHDAILSDDPWTTAENFTPHTTGIDTLAVAIT